MEVMRLQRQEEKRRAIGCSYSPKGNNESFSGLLSFTGRIKSAYILFIYLFFVYIARSSPEGDSTGACSSTPPVDRAPNSEPAPSLSLSLSLSFSPSTPPPFHPSTPSVLRSYQVTVYLGVDATVAARAPPRSHTSPCSLLFSRAG